MQAQGMRMYRRNDGDACLGEKRFRLATTGSTILTIRPHTKVTRRMSARAQIGRSHSISIHLEMSYSPKQFFFTPHEPHDTSTSGSTRIFLRSNTTLFYPCSIFNSSLITLSQEYEKSNLMCRSHNHVRGTEYLTPMASSLTTHFSMPSWVVWNSWQFLRRV